MVFRYVVLLALALLWNLAVWWQVRRARTMAGGETGEPVGGTYRQVTSWGAWLPLIGGIPWLAGFNAYTGGRMLALAWVMPLAALMAALQTARGWGPTRGRKVISAVLTCYNGLLFLMLTVRFLSYLGLGLGSWGDALLLDDAWAQARTVFFLALFMPVFPHPPVLMPLGGPGRKAWTVLAAAPALVAFATSWDWAVTYPGALRVVRELRALPLPRDPAPERPDFAFSTKVLSTLGRVQPGQHLDQDLRAARDLGLDTLTLFLNVDILDHPGDRRYLRERLGRDKRGALRLVVVCWGSDLWLQRPPPERELLRRMQALHQYAARDLGADLLVPFSEPYGDSLLLLGKRLKPERWAEMVRDSADRLKGIRPRPRIGLHFAEYSREEERLFRLLARPDSGVDVLGFSLYPTLVAPRRFVERVRTAERWMQSDTSGKRYWVLETGLSPLSHGEAAQERSLRYVVQWALRQPRMEGVSQYSLGDYGEVMGLVSAAGRRRPAFAAYREMVLSASGRGRAKTRPSGQRG